MKKTFYSILLAILAFIVSLFACFLVYDSFFKSRTGTKEDKYNTGMEYIGTFALISLFISLLVFLYRIKRKN